MILCIYGAGGSGKTIVDLARIINRVEKRWTKIIFIDDVTNEKIVYGIEVYSFEEIMKKYEKENIEFTISVGEPSGRKILFNKIKEKGLKFAQLIHPEAEISKDSKLGEGVIIAKSSVWGGSSIGNNVFVSQNAIIGHDTTIEAHCILSPLSFIAGYCQIGECTYIGPHAAVRDRIKIGNNAIAALAAGIYKDIPDNYVAIGNPAKNMPREKNAKVF